MASIFGKLRTLVLSNIHSLLDKAIDLNSIEAVKQHIRDLENAIEETETSAAVAQGDMKTTSDEVKNTLARVTELQENIDFILGDGDDTNDHLATPLVEKLIGLEEALKTQREVEAANQSILANLEEVIAKLRNKHVQMVGQIAKLEVMERAAIAKNKAAEAIKQAAAMSGDEVSIDNVSARVTRQSNIADAKLNRAMGEFNSKSDDPVRNAQVAARLAAMKARIKSA
jgi:phage shock protein A